MRIPPLLSPLLLLQLHIGLLVGGTAGVVSSSPATTTTSSRDEDRIKSLPGYHHPLETPWYSGYLTYPFNGTMIHTHYVYIETEHPSGGSAPDEKPLIYWTNGGPGASSLFGLFTELGPLLFSDNSYQTEDYRLSGIPTPLPNKRAWTGLGSVLVFDAPAPVGFSYCGDKKEKPVNNATGRSCGAWNDTLASQNSFLALQAFYDKFPETRKRDLYITGESYAGIYVPTMARRVLEHNGKVDEHERKADASVTRTLAIEKEEKDKFHNSGNDNKNNNNNLRLEEEEGTAISGREEEEVVVSGRRKGGEKKINLKGFAVGDGCLGTETSICGGSTGTFQWYWELLFLAGHGQIPYSTYKKVMDLCNDGKDGPFSTLTKGGRGGTRTSITGGGGLISKECQKAVAKARGQVGGYFAYSLYDECTYRNNFLASWINGDIRDGGGGDGGGAAAADDESGDEEDSVDGGTSSLAYSYPTMPWKNVDGALNDYPCGGGLVMGQWLDLPAVREALHIPDGVKFFEVDNAEGFDYTPTEKDLTSFYAHVARNVSDVRVLVYNGDVDPAITSSATQNWTSHIGLNVTQDWRPWTVDGCLRIGGYVTRYEGDLDYVTIRGAGHMVPTYKPDATYTFLKSWLKGSDYPRYDKGCKVPPGMWKAFFVGDEGEIDDSQKPH